MWGNFYQVWKYEKPVKFPFVNRQGRKFNDSKDLLDFIIKNYGKEKSSTMYSSVLNICPIIIFYDKQVQNYYERYFFSERFNLKPFKNADSYDQMPALYLDFCVLMSNEINEYKKEIAKQHANK